MIIRPKNRKEFFQKKVITKIRFAFYLPTYLISNSTADTQQRSPPVLPNQIFISRRAEQTFSTHVLSCLTCESDFFTTEFHLNLSRKVNSATVIVITSQAQSNPSRWTFILSWRTTTSVVSWATSSPSWTRTLSREPLRCQGKNNCQKIMVLSFVFALTLLLLQFGLMKIPKTPNWI